jgi:glycosyltransferase involved in cell wall biosynthesis
MHTDSSVLRISYAGTLAWYDPAIHPRPEYSWKNWFWGFKALRVDFTTRSGYYLFMGLQELLRRDISWQERVQVDLWGLIDRGNVEQVRKMGLENMVSIGGYLPKEESIRKLSQADVMFLPLESGRDGTRPIYIPGKLFEMLLLGKPILALAGASDCRDILERSGLSCAVAPDQPSAIADAIEKLYQNRHGLNRQFRPDQAYISGFSAAAKTQELAKVFDLVLNR